MPPKSPGSTTSTAAALHPAHPPHLDYCNTPTSSAHPSTFLSQICEQNISKDPWAFLILRGKAKPSVQSLKALLSWCPHLSALFSPLQTLHSESCKRDILLPATGHLHTPSAWESFSSFPDLCSAASFHLKCSLGRDLSSNPPNIGTLSCYSFYLICGSFQYLFMECMHILPRELHCHSLSPLSLSLSLTHCHGRGPERGRRGR